MRIAGWSFGKSEARLAVLPAIAIAGCAIWLMLPQASDAEGHSTATPSERHPRHAGHIPHRRYGRDPGDPVEPGAHRCGRHSADVAPPATVEPDKSPLDGLKIVSQSWRRGGLGSKALVTFTLRNANDYAVKDIEIACTFTRRDGQPSDRPPGGSFPIP